MYAYNWIKQNTSPWNEKTLWYRIHPCLLSTTDLGIFFGSLWCNGNVCNVAHQPPILVEWTSSLRCILYKKQKDTVDGWNPAPVQIVSLSHYFQGFIHPRWCRISAINSITETYISCFDFTSHTFFWSKSRLSKWVRKLQMVHFPLPC